MEGFHRRYMASNRAMRAWGAMVRRLDIETIAPQHGAMFQGRAMCERFIAWCEALPCGVDLIDDLYPTAAG
jgi:flavorubredoxin